MIIKNGFLKMMVNKPNETIVIATINGNHARLFRSRSPSVSAINVRTTKIVVARINVVNSEAIKKPIIGPSSMNRFRKSFLSMIMEYFVQHGDMRHYAPHYEIGHTALQLVVL